MYWAITTLTLVIITVFPSLSIGSTVRAEDITQWYLLFPTRNDDGRIEPLLGVGWTLYFETFFYLLITISLALKRSPFVFAPPVLLLFAAASLFRRSDWPAWSVYLSPRVLEFLLGMSIAWSIDKINAGPRLGAATLLTGLIMLVLTDPLNGSQQIIAHARSATMILAGVVWLETVLSGRISKFLLFYGAGSYTLYLIHPIVAPGIPFLMAKMRLDAPSVSIAGCIAVSLIAAAFVHKFFEVPVLAFGNSWLGRILERSNFEQLAKDQPLRISKTRFYLLNA
jgi:peptidoglycan/LPS O-acetylase OafA/YrhL